jgi:hypothetical protein
MTERLYRLGHQTDQGWCEHSHPAVYELPLDNASQRIVATVPGSNPEVVLQLAQCLEEPLCLLYILHTPRGAGEAGRYQSPALSAAEVREFFAEFAPLLTGDGRFDLWISSPGQKATLAWDRHNLLYAYGPLDAFAQRLDAMGFSVGVPTLPPHSHHYRVELDDLASRLLAHFTWTHSPLRPGDEQ